jgi:hypothetical protein
LSCLGLATLVLLGAGCKDEDAGLIPDGSDGGAFASDGAMPEVDSGELDAGTDAEVEADVTETDGSTGEPNDAGHDADIDAEVDAGDAAVAPELTLEIKGRWHSSWGGVEEIEDDAWSAYGTSAVLEYDNETNSLITQNPADDTWSPNKFNKIVWTEIEDGSFYYCIVDYGLDTAADARNTTKTADDSDPESTGCGGFNWTKLSPTLEIEGRWHSSFGGMTVLDSDDFVSASASAAIASYDNEANWLVTQNASNAPVSPNKFNKVVWTEIDDDGFFYCTVDRGLDTAAGAADSDKTANEADLAHGCRGYPWTKLSPVIEIEGRWHSNWGGIESIDSDAFTGYGTSAITEYDNQDNSMITQNPPDASWAPSKFNKIVWTELEGGTFYYCTVAFSLDTAEAARSSTATADDSDPESGGCGGFSWTRLETPIAIEGIWTTGSEHVAIDSDDFADQSVVSYDNAARSVITQNPNAGENPLEFNKVVWTGLHEASFHYCVVSSNQASAALAESSASTATADNLTTGCNGAAWTALDAL